MSTAAEIDPLKLQALEEKFDPEMRFRPTLPPATTLVKWLLIVLSCFHYYTAGFGLLRETTHRGVHLALSSTVGSEAWNSRDLKSRPH